MSAVGAVGAVSQGVVNYPVTVHITDADAELRPGMTAAVSIIVTQHDDVLYVPNRAIRTSGRDRIVTVLYEGEQISVVVTVGLTNDTVSEVSSDQLREGDVVVLTGSTSTSSGANNQNRGNPGGFGGPGGILPSNR